MKLLFLFSFFSFFSFFSLSAYALNYPTSIDNNQNMDQLGRKRIHANEVEFEKDFCLNGPSTEDSFANSISRGVELAMNEKEISTNSAIDKGYKLSSKRIPLSLISHPFCTVDQAELKHSLKKDPKLNTAELAKIKGVINSFNTTRSKYFSASSTQDKQFYLKEYSEKYSIFMGCLAYSESLNDPDSSGSYGFAVVSDSEVSSNAFRLRAMFSQDGSLIDAALKISSRQ